MNNINFNENDYFDFLCKKSIPYGETITVLEEPKKYNGKWVVSVLDAEANLTEIYIKKGKITGEHFIVMNSSLSEENFYCHHAVPVEKIEQTTKRIENEIISLLRAK